MRSPRRRDDGGKEYVVKGRLSWLSTVERDLVVESALAILERVGMRMKGAEVLDDLEERGARVDRESGVVRLPEAVVRAALAALPEGLFLAGATPVQDLVMDRRNGPHFNPSACIAKTLDFRTGQVRPATLQDIREGTTVMDATPEIDLMWTFATANDVPLGQRELIEYYTYLANTSKPLIFVDCPQETGAVRRIMEILGGTLEGFRARPRLGLLCAIRAPLEVHGDLLDVACEFARLGAPILAYSMPMCGATSAVTMGGTLAQIWAEVLGVVTAVQTAAPGSAMVACCGPGILDMRTSAMSLGSPENTMMGAASVEIGHHLGLPVHNSGLSTDAKHLDLQAGYEKGMKALPAALAGVDLISGGFGALDSSSVWHLPMVPVDAEVARLVKRLAAGIEVTPETVMLDVIERVGVGGNFLREKVTRERVRAGEHFSPVIGSRLPFEQWVVEGRQETDVALDIVESTLAAAGEEGSGSLLSDDQLAALREVCGAG
jgi:trimethylamine---corrinoid protein Co-methyltransferase